MRSTASLLGGATAAAARTAAVGECSTPSGKYSSMKCSNVTSMCAANRVNCCVVVLARLSRVQSTARDTQRSARHVRSSRYAAAPHIITSADSYTLLAAPVPFVNHPNGPSTALLHDQRRK